MSKHNKQHKPSASHRGPTPQPPKPTPEKESPKDNPSKPGTWVRKQITATLRSDAHLGSGVGGQGLHALLARDRQGRPVIWSSHLEGLLREAARALEPADEAARALYRADEARLFGKAGGTRQQLVFTSLYLVEKEAPQSRVWRSTARESFDNRAPDKDTLRAIEFVPEGTKFEGEVELKKGDVGTLERLLQEIESIGHGRASGAGQVSLVLGEPTTRKPPHQELHASDVRIRLLLCCLDPLCVATTSTPGNIIPTLPFVPGRTLQGALVSWLLMEGSAETRKVAELFVEGKVAVSDALPLDQTDEQPSLAAIEVLPAPLSLQSKKPTEQKGEVPWWARQTTPAVRVIKKDKQDKDRQDKDLSQEKLKRPEPDLFVQRVGPDKWEAYRPDIRVRLRNGRPITEQEDPSLFAVEQISERTLFFAELRCEKQEHVRKVRTALWPLLQRERWLRVGRSGCAVEIVDFKGLSIEDGAEGIRAKTAYLTLTSDLLFRDEQLRWQTRLTADNVKDLPGWADGFTKGLTEEIFKPVLQEETEIRGFNGTSGLWRLPAAGIRRGSVFKVNAALANKLRESASKGAWLGERTHEGFGRFRIDEEDKLPGVTPDLKEEADSAKGANPAKGASPGKIRAGRPDDPSEQVAHKTKDWKDKYVGKETQVRTDEPASDPKPSLSQWQDLVTELDQEKSAVPVLRESKALKSRRNPKTAGAAGWKHRAAQTILDELEKQTDRAKQAEHARMFVRWLRADLKQKREDTKQAMQEVAG